MIKFEDQQYIETTNVFGGTHSQQVILNKFEKNTIEVLI